MGPKHGNRNSNGGRHAGIGRSATEIVVALSASLIMTLMVAIGGVAAERITSAEIAGHQGTPDEPGLLLPNEST